MSELTHTAPEHEQENEARRDFLYLAVAGTATVGAAAAIWPRLPRL